MRPDTKQSGLTQYELNMNNKKKKYFFCYLRTGGGHLAPARSIAKYLVEQHGGSVEPVLVDGLTDANATARFIIEDGYRILQAKAKWYYELIYALNKFPPIGWLNVTGANYFIKPYLKKKILEEKPAKIVILHFLLIAPIYEIVSELNLEIPVITIVTDPFTAHPMWFQRKEQRYIVFSERLKDKCIQKGIDSKQLDVFSFIIDNKFASMLANQDLEQLRLRFGIDQNQKMVLIIGGGDGIPHGKAILQNLLSNPLSLQIAIVCGKNKELYSDAMKLKAQFPDLHVFGFVDFVYELLNIADVVITKCGASTIMEILMMKKIPIIIDYLWEQELGNMEFVRDNHLGIFERNISKLPAIISNLISDEEQYNKFLSNIEQQQLRNGTKDVGEFLLTV